MSRLSRLCLFVRESLVVLNAGGRGTVVEGTRVVRACVCGVWVKVGTATAAAAADLLTTAAPTLL